MSTPERQLARSSMVAAAQEIGEKLKTALQDPACKTVMLSREEAVVVAGLMAGAAQVLTEENLARAGNKEDDAEASE